MLVYSWDIPIPIGSGFQFPTGIAVDGGGNVYIVDGLANAFYKETPTVSGYVQSTIDTNLGGPESVSVDSNGNVYVFNAGNNSIYKETYSAGSYTRSVLYTPATPNPLHVSVQAGTIDSLGNLYFTDDVQPSIVYQLQLNQTPESGIPTQWASTR